MIIKKTPDTIDKFLTMYSMGEKMTDIAKVLDVSRQVLYQWLEMDDVKAELERRRQECKDAGNEFIKGRYLQYLKNINDLATQTDDKRTAFTANQFLIEKMDGKNRTMIDVTTSDKDKEIVDDNVLKEIIDDNDEGSEETTDNA